MANRPHGSDRLVALARKRSGLNHTDFARAAGTSRSAIAEYENGRRVPRFDVMDRALAVGGLRLDVVADTAAQDPPDRRPTLADVMSEVGTADPQWTWRALVSGWVANDFVRATASERMLMVAAVPDRLDDERWNTFACALAEHLCFHAEITVPSWSTDADALEPCWWPVHGDLPTMRTGAFVRSPASFARRGIFVDGTEIPRVLP